MATRTKNIRKPATKRAAEKPVDAENKRAAEKAAPGEYVPNAEELIASMRGRGIQDDGIAFLLTLEANQLVRGASALVAPKTDGKPLSAKKAELALRIVELAEQSFESGEEVPGVEVRTRILREALRAAKDDLNFLAAAERQLGDCGSAAQAFLRAEYRIDLALALYEFGNADDESAEMAARVGEMVEREGDRVRGVRRQLDAAGGAS